MRSLILTTFMTFIALSSFGQVMKINEHEFKTKNASPISLINLDVIKFSFNPENQIVKQFNINAISCLENDDEITLKMLYEKVSVETKNRFDIEKFENFTLKKLTGCIDRIIIEIAFQDVNEPINVIFIYKEDEK